MLTIIRIISFMLLVCSAPAMAQKNSIVLTWLPTASVEPDAGFTAGVEYGLGNRWSVLTDAGIILYSPSQSQRNNNNGRNGILGYKIKPEVRFYFPDKKVLKGGFVSIQGLYKHVNYQRYDGLPVFDNLGNLAYTYLGGYRIIKDVIGFNIKLGYRFYFSAANKIGMEVYGGLGSRHKNFSLRDIPPGGVFDREFFQGRLFSTHWEEGGLPSAAFGFKLIWRVR
jgi:Protein of unknown function (DUF3575)